MAFEFDDDAHRDGYDTVCAYLKLLNLPVVPVDDTNFPTLQLRYSDAPSLVIFVVSWEGADALVKFRSHLVRDFTVTSDALTYVMRKNDSNLFAWFALDEDNWLTLNQAMLASDLGRESVEVIIDQVTNGPAADDFIARFGGQRCGAWST